MSKPAFLRPLSAIFSPGVLVLVWSCVALPAFAGEEYFRMDEVLASRMAKEVLAAPVSLYWGTQATPAFVETTRPDTYTGTAISLSPFGGSRRHCVEAFDLALKAVVDEAVARGYDSIAGLRVVVDDVVFEDTESFRCTPGYKVTRVGLRGSFANSAEGMQRAKEAELASFNVPPRAPWEGTIVIPLEPILASVEAKAILGGDIDAYVGAEAPPYSERLGPETYSDEGDVKRNGKEGACKEAVLKVLQELTDRARDEKYNAIIKLRSYLYGEYTPVATDVDCEVDEETASVALSAALATRK